MNWFSNVHELEGLLDDPELWQTLYGYMAVCQYEFLQTESEDDLIDHDFAFAVATISDLEDVLERGAPEEVTVVSIYYDGQARRIVRLTFPAEVLFYIAEPSEDLESLFVR